MTGAVGEGAEKKTAIGFEQVVWDQKNFAATSFFFSMMLPDRRFGSIVRVAKEQCWRAWLGAREQAKALFHLGEELEPPFCP